MCGVFGAIRVGKGELSIKALKDMAEAAEARGPHAWGLSWIDSRKNIHAYKRPGRISSQLAFLDRLAGAEAVIGHTRWATHGAATDNMNNHPHPCDGGWLVHNGVVFNHAELAAKYHLPLVTQCDTEVLAQLIGRVGGGLSSVRRVARSCAKVEIDSPLVVLAVWNRPGRVVACRRGNPLYISVGTSGNAYLCSVAEGMPGKPAEFPDGMVQGWDLASGSIGQETIATPEAYRAKVAGSGRVMSTGTQYLLDDDYSCRLCGEIGCVGGVD